MTGPQYVPEPHPTFDGAKVLKLPGVGHMLEVTHFPQLGIYPFIATVVQDRWSQEQHDNGVEGYEDRRQEGHLTNAHAQALADFLAEGGFVPYGYVKSRSKKFATANVAPERTRQQRVDAGELCEAGIAGCDCK